MEKADKRRLRKETAVTYHTIKSGDTLGALARRYGTTVSKLCSLNGIKSTTILRLGRKLRVPLNKQTSRNRAGCGMKLAPYRMMRLRKQIIK